jgi:hypothetical protein
VSLLGALRARWVARLRARSVLSLVRMACWAALLALAIMCASILDPMPLTVIFAMSVGHVIGGFAFLCYLLSMLADSIRRGSDPSIAPGSKAAEPRR